MQILLGLTVSDKIIKPVSMPLSVAPARPARVSPCFQHNDTPGTAAFKDVAGNLSEKKKSMRRDQFDALINNSSGSFSQHPHRSSFLLAEHLNTDTDTHNKETHLRKDQPLAKFNQHRAFELP